LFHVVRALRAAGIAAADPTCVRAARWLVGAQRSDGGWGEHYSGSLHDRYVAHAHSQVVMTAWAILALLDTVGPAAPAVRAGIDWLRRAQGTDGAWPLGAVNGVFFGSAMLDYRLYTVYFPTWALARYHHLRSSGGTEWSDAHDIRRRDA
jgi:lanosterol synthase